MDREYYREQYHLGNNYVACIVCGSKDMAKHMLEIDVGRDKAMALAGNKSCPTCDHGLLLKRTNKNKLRLFIGCSNYPQCNYTEKYEGKWYKNNKPIIATNRRSPEYYCQQHSEPWLEMFAIKAALDRQYRIDNGLPVYKAHG